MDMESLTKGNTSRDASSAESPFADSVQMARAELEARQSAQRMRNASAVVRAQQKVARERRKPIRPQKY
jgi:hypothetical protein